MLKLKSHTIAASLLIGAALVREEKAKHAKLKGSFYHLESEKADLEAELAIVKSKIEAFQASVAPEKAGVATTDPIEDDFLLVIHEFFAEDIPESCTVRIKTITIEDSPYITDYYEVYCGEKFIGYVANLTDAGLVIGLSPDFAPRGVKSVDAMEVEVVQGEVKVVSGATPMTAAIIEACTKEVINDIKNAEAKVS